MFFTKAVAPGCWTLTSLSSVFTGQRPSNHGIIAREDVYRISRYDTIASELSKADLRTSLITNSNLITRLGKYDSGFDSVTNPDAKAALFNNGLNPDTDLRLSSVSGVEMYARALATAIRTDKPLRSVANLTYSKIRSKLPATASTAEDGSRGDGAILEAAVESIDAAIQDGDRFATFLHMGGVHEPWSYRPSLLEDVGVSIPETEEPNWERASELSGADDVFNRFGVQIDPELVPLLTRLYEAYVNRVDDLAGELLEQLVARDIAEETLVVLTSDHGKVIEADFLGHGVAHSDVYHVPLAIRGPGIEDVVVDDPVDLCDLYYAIRSATGVVDRQKPQMPAERTPPATCESFRYLIKSGCGQNLEQTDSIQTRVTLSNEDWDELIDTDPTDVLSSELDDINASMD